MAGMNTGKTIIEIVTGGKDPTSLTLSDVQNILDYARTLLIWIGAVSAFVGLIMASITYFTAYGNEAKAETAKKRILYIFIGMIIIILANVIIYEVLRFIMPASNINPIPVNVVSPLGN
ncbi:MAG: hypothetical protein WC773_03435 [Patescibacteria group bacterium]|jgi:Na+-driven multidrug efflux pump